MGRSYSLLLFLAVGGCGLVSGLDGLSVGDGSAPLDASGIDASPTDAILDTLPIVDVVGVDANPIAAIQGLSLWLDANRGVTTLGGNVVTWADQSGNDNNATQGGSSIQPKLNVGNFAGFPSVHFSADVGSSLIIQDSSTLQFGTGPFILAIAARLSNHLDAGSGPAGTFFYKEGALGFFGNELTATTGLEGDLDNVSIRTSPLLQDNDGIGRLFVLLRSGLSTVSIRVNGVQNAQLPAVLADVSGVGKPVILGVTGASLDRLEGDIAEVIAVKNATDVDLMTVESYLRTKYGW